MSNTALSVGVSRALTNPSYVRVNIVLFRVVWTFSTQYWVWRLVYRVKIYIQIVLFAAITLTQLAPQQNLDFSVACGHQCSQCCAINDYVMAL